MLYEVLTKVNLKGWSGFKKWFETVHFVCAQRHLLVSTISCLTVENS